MMLNGFNVKLFLKVAYFNFQHELKKKHALDITPMYLGKHLCRVCEPVHWCAQ